MWSPNTPRLLFWANSECNLHVPIGAKLDQSAGHIQNVLILYSLGILELYFAEHWKCAQFFAHWVHWSHMAGHIQNVLRMYPLGISGSHSGVHLKCTQHSSANLVVTYSLICAFLALIFPRLLIHTFYLFLTYPHFLLIPNFSRAYPLIKYIK